MKISKYLPKVLFMIAMAVTVVFLSCDEFNDVKNEINIIVTCSGSTTDNNFSVAYIIDNDPPITLPITGTVAEGAATFYPAGNITTATITATKADTNASLTILVYKNGSIDKKGYSNLPSCTSSGTSSCTNTLVLKYEVNPEEDTTKGTSGTTSTTTSSSTSGS